MNVTVINGGQNLYSGQVSGTHFGGISTSYQKNSAFATQGDALNIGLVRWPGGTRAEFGLDPTHEDRDGNTTEYYYDVTRNEVIAGNDKGLSGALQYAHDNGLPFSMVIPTARYMSTPDAGALDARLFVSYLLERVRNGTLDLPEDFTLEIGSETVGQSVADAVAYAQVADAQIMAIRELVSDRTINPYGTDIRIAVQMGRTLEADEALRDTLSDGALQEVDAVVEHNLVLNIRSHNRPILDGELRGLSQFEIAQRLASIWEQDVGEARGLGSSVDLQHFVSAWSVGAGSESTDDNIGYLDVGARQARTVIDTFAQMIGTGVDAAAVWGIGSRQSENWFSLMADGTVTLSHGGEAFKLMSESLVGSHLIGDFSQPVSSSAPDAVEPYWTYTYENEQEFIIFLVANDIDEDQQVRLDIEGVGGISSATGTRIGTIYTSTAGTDSSVIDDRLLERPAVADVDVGYFGSTIYYTLTQDYEVLRIIVQKLPESLPTSQGSGGSDRMDGSTFAENLFGQDGNDTIAGGIGNDRLEGEAGDDSLMGEAGDDWIVGGTGRDSLFGGDGDDILSGGANADEMSGGRGDDTFTVDSAMDLIREFAGEGVDSVNSSLSHALGANIENLTLVGSATHGFGNDVNNLVVGNNLSNRLDGRNGSDSLLGGAGNDILIGGSGDDLLDGDAGADRMAGSLGDDRYTVDNSRDLVTERASEGIDLVIADVSFTLPPNTENLTLTGAAPIKGFGNTLNNVITGNSAANRLVGGRGDDVLIGGPGNDTLIGGLGADTFLFDTAPDAGANYDSVIDFDIARDHIALELAVFVGLMGSSGSALSPDQFWTGTAAHDLDDRILYDAVTGGLYYDADGSATGSAATLLAELAPSLQMMCSDFILT